MAVELKIGDRAVTRGPLKPSGQIRVDEVSIAAMSQGEWIDNDTEVEIVVGNQTGREIHS